MPQFTRREASNTGIDFHLRVVPLQFHCIPILPPPEGHPSGMSILSNPFS